MKRAMFYLAFVIAMPLVPILMAGRIVFFGAWNLWEAACAWARPAVPQHIRPRLWPFWLAWCVAVLCVAAAIAMGVVGLNVITDWPKERQWMALAPTATLSVLALCGAYRAALAGTRSLQRALAGNLAMLIALELDQLRIATEQRAQLLHVGRQIKGSDVAAICLPVPAFFAEREEIRDLLGEPTERALVDLLNSLQGFNLALVAGDRPIQVSGVRVSGGQVSGGCVSGSDLDGHLSVIYAHLGRALSSLAPHLRPAAS